MALDSIKSILMKRDGMTAEDAENLINEARAEAMERLENGDIFDIDSDICYNYFGLEPDYFWEIMPI